MTQFRSFSLLLLLLLLLDEITKGRGFIPLAKPKNQVIQRISHQRLLHGASKEGTDVINRKTNSKNNNDGESDTGASIPNLTISLIKSIVGGGVLAVPAGFAAMGGSPDIVPIAVATVVCSGVLNAFYFRLMGKVCETTQAETYRQAWERTVGVESSPWVNMIVTAKTALSCLAFSMIIADSGQALAQAAGLVDITRTEALLGVTGIVLLPLTLQRDLSSLAPFSFVGVLGVLITTATIAIRYQDGSYLMETGTFAQDLPTQLQPHFVDSTNSVAAVTASDVLTNSATAGTFGSWSGVVLSCTLATAYVAHYNAPRFFNELQDSSVERFQKVTYASYAVAAVLFVVVGCCGFLTFGQASQGYILNNYSPTDPLANFCKAALTGSILCTYPLPFVGLRDGCLDLLDVSDRDQVHAVTTVALLSIITMGALLVSDLGLVLSVGGGTFSTAVSAVFPVCMFLAMDSDNKSIVEQIAAGLGMLFSVSIGVAGVSIALGKAAATAAAVST